MLDLACSREKREIERGGVSKTEQDCSNEGEALNVQTAF